MKKNHNITIFYHVFQAPGWQLLFNQQIYHLFISGLYDAANTIYLCINGDDKLPFQASKFIVKRNSRTIDEAETIENIWRFSQGNVNHKILYMHTKSVSHQLSIKKINTDAWRLYMEYFNVHQWQECVHLLDTHDCVGTKWEHMTTVIWNDQLKIRLEKDLGSSGCYDGNFWWANSSYLKTLDVQHLRQMDPYFEQFGLDEKAQHRNIRGHSEMWLGTGNPNYYSFEKFSDNLYFMNILNRMEKFAA